MMFKSLKNTIQSLEKNEISIKELSQEYIKNIKEKSNLNIFIHFDEQKILNQVEILEKDKSKKKLKGIPLAIKDLNLILDWVEQLNEVNTNKVEPLSNISSSILPKRDDVSNDTNSSEEILENAPDKLEGFFAVPKVVE